MSKRLARSSKLQVTDNKGKTCSDMADSRTKDEKCRCGSLGTAGVPREISQIPKSVWAHTALQPQQGLQMAKLLRLALATILCAACALYLTLRMMLAANSQPAPLLKYPSADTIEHIITRKMNCSTPIQPPLSTAGRYIVDSHNKRIKLASVNWYGASDELFVVGGLEIQHRDDIASAIRRLGFNSVRLPYSDQLVRDNPVVASNLLTANPDLIGLPALDIFAAVVRALTGSGLAVIINNHITQARWCCDANLCDGEWSNDHLSPFCPVRQTQEDWIQHLETIMAPHVNDSLVIGVDLRNEVRGIRDRLLWNSWVDAAEQAAERLHRLQPEWLIFVEGVSSANVLSGVSRRPVRLSRPNKLVYSVHVYGWSGWGTLRPYWRRPYKSFADDMYNHWAFLLEDNVAPVWLGEFGAPDSPNRGDLHYWTNLMRYMAENDVDFGYWALNPRKPHDNERESYGLLMDDWQTVRYDYRLYDLVGLMSWSKDCIDRIA